MENTFSQTAQTSIFCPNTVQWCNTGSENQGKLFSVKLYRIKNKIQLQQYGVNKRKTGMVGSKQDPRGQTRTPLAQHHWNSVWRSIQGTVCSLAPTTLRQLSSSQAAFTWCPTAFPTDDPHSWQLHHPKISTILGSSPLQPEASH